MEKLFSGKVREIYKIHESGNSKLIIVTTDRISAFDVVLSKPVPDKGKILNAVSAFWFSFTNDIIANHIISNDLKDMPPFFQKSEFEGRAVLVKKLDILPFEFIVRGYMFGSMWEDYSKTGQFCGEKIRQGYELAQKLDEPLFTVSTKAQTGHDEYITLGEVKAAIGEELTEKIKDISIKLYNKCYDYAYQKGIIIADTKFEFGLDENNNLLLADEIFTPDSSRFWSIKDYKTGISPRSFDKQFVRDWLLNNKIDGKMQFDNIPDEILLKTAEIYKQCLNQLTN